MVIKMYGKRKEYYNYCPNCGSKRTKIVRFLKNNDEDTEIKECKCLHCTIEFAIHTKEDKSYWTEIKH